MINRDVEPTRARVLARMIETLESAGVEDARRNSEWILCDVLRVSRAELYAYPERELNPNELTEIFDMLARRSNREPLQYILGYTEFFDLRIKVTPDVLIPRPETEQVVEEALRLIGFHAKAAPAVLDIGTGSGCIALTVKHWRPATDVYACDASAEAIAVAEENALLLGIKLRFVHADVRDPDFSRSFLDPFDLIISNPPYVLPDEFEALEPEIREFEPRSALVSDEPLEHYGTISRHAMRMLVPGGWLVFETHASHGLGVLQTMEREGLEELRLEKDLAGRDRIAVGRRPSEIKP